MIPGDNNTVGRTAWDFASELVRSWRLLLLVVPLLGVAVAAFVASVHFGAAPGTEVYVFWGLAKYQKSSARQVRVEEPPAAVTNGYVLPKDQPTHGYSFSGPAPVQTFAILDRAISFSNDDKETVLGGAEIAKVSVAGRNEKGEPLRMARDSRSGVIKVVARGDSSHVELGYKGNFFAIDVEHSSEAPPQFSVTAISHPSLSLTPYDDL